jgi:hypothetical protein
VASFFYVYQYITVKFQWIVGSSLYCSLGLIRLTVDLALTSQINEFAHVPTGSLIRLEACILALAKEDPEIQGWLNTVITAGDPVIMAASGGTVHYIRSFL